MAAEGRECEDRASRVVKVLVELKHSGFGCGGNEAQDVMIPDGGDMKGEVQSNVKLALAYGSNVFSQGEAAGQAGMLDLMLVVDDPVEWHRAALDARGDDYSWLARNVLGASGVASVQQSGGGKVWFNAGARFSGVMGEVKYGVISVADLVEDLKTWETLYLSGRLHKPVRILHKNDVMLTAALRCNLDHAVHSALLLLPETFDELDFFRCISNISYSGDVRMMFAESPNKVENIVVNNAVHFRELYQQYYLSQGEHSSSSCFFGEITSVGNAVVGSDRLKLQQNFSPTVRASMWSAHPLAPKLPSWESVQFDAEAQRRELLKALSRVVNRSSRVQTAKGLLTAGPLSAAMYGLRKVGKRFGVV